MSYQKYGSSPFSASIKTQTRKKKFGLNEDQQIQIKQAFDLFDPHKTSYVSYHELKVILRALGFQVKKSQVVQMAREFDIQESGNISYDNYFEIMRRKYNERDPIEETLKAFRLFDVDNKGKISLNDLRRVAKQLGETLKQEDLMSMIEQFDRDGDGQINQEEFLAVIKPSIL